MGATARDKRWTPRTAVWSAPALLFVAASVASAQVAVKAFDEAVTIHSFRVDAAVAEIPGTQIADKGDADFSLAVGYAGGLVATGEVGMIGKTAAADKSFGYFAAAGGFASADVWSEFAVTAPAVPETVRYGDEDKPLEFIEVQIRGRVREADLDATVCGAAWTAQLTGAHIQSTGPPDADYDFPSVGCILPEGEVLDTISKIQDAFEVISKIEQGLAVAQVGFGIWEDFVVRILLDLRDVPRQQPFDMAVQLGRRVGSALAAASISGGEIQVESIRIVGWIGMDTTATLRTFHRYSDGPTSADRLVDTTTYNVKRCLPPYNIEPCPTVTFTCPPYPLLPTQRIGGRIYAIQGDRLWRLEYLERDRDPATRVSVTGTTCNYGPVEMDRSHRVVLGFQLGVADLVIAGFRTVPAQPQAGAPFNLYVAVRNAGDLSTLDADRTAPLDGRFTLRIRVGNAASDHTEVFVLQPGATQEFPVGAWRCEAPLVEATVDAGDEIVEGYAGESTNQASLSLPQCHPVSPTPTFTATTSPTRSVTPTTTSTKTPTRTTTPSVTRTSTATRTPTRTATPTATASVTRTASPTRTGTRTRTPTRTATATHSGSPTRSATPTKTPTSTGTATHTQTPRVPTVTATPSATATPPVRTSTPTATPTVERAAADVNCDGRLSAADLPALLVLLAGGGMGPCGTADVNGDHLFDDEDAGATVGAIFGP